MIYSISVCFWGVYKVIANLVDAWLSSYETGVCSYQTKCQVIFYYCPIVYSYAAKSYSRWKDMKYKTRWQPSGSHVIGTQYMQI